MRVDKSLEMPELPAVSKPGFAPDLPPPYFGFDISTYPGDSKMQTWWSSSPFYFVGFYLAPAPHHSNTSWMTKYSVLSGQGWGAIPIYVGRQSGDGSLLTAAQGRADAHSAANLAIQAGMPQGFGYLYLDVESGGTLSSAFINYIKAWIVEMDTNTTFWAGVYCSYSHTAAQIRAAIGANTVCRFWCFNVNCPPSPGCTTPSSAPNPANCGYSEATTWQYAQDPQPGGVSCVGYTGGHCQPQWDGVSLLVDLDSSLYQHPANL
jgi:hypothetical protein